MVFNILKTWDNILVFNSCIRNFENSLRKIPSKVWPLNLPVFGEYTKPDRSQIATASKLLLTCRPNSTQPECPFQMPLVVFAWSIAVETIFISDSEQLTFLWQWTSSAAVCTKSRRTTEQVNDSSRAQAALQGGWGAGEEGAGPQGSGQVQPLCSPLPFSLT